MYFSFFLLFVLCLIRVRLVPSNGFENALVLCSNWFLSQIWDTFAFA